MTSSSPRPTGRAALRLWWALPVAALAGTAVGMAVVVGPTLGEHVSIPRELAVSAASAAPSLSTAAQRSVVVPPKPRATKAAPAHAAAPVPSPSWSPPRQTRVVSPQRPVVTAPAEDGYEHESESPSTQSSTQPTATPSEHESEGTDR